MLIYLSTSSLGIIIFIIELLIKKSYTNFLCKILVDGGKVGFSHLPKQNNLVSPKLSRMIILVGKELFLFTHFFRIFSLSLFCLSWDNKGWSDLQTNRKIIWQHGRAIAKWSRACVRSGFVVGVGVPGLNPAWGCFFSSE